MEKYALKKKEDMVSTLGACRYDKTNSSTKSLGCTSQRSGKIGGEGFEDPYKGDEATVKNRATKLPIHPQ